MVRPQAGTLETSETFSPLLYQYYLRCILESRSGFLFAEVEYQGRQILWGVAATVLAIQKHPIS